MNARNYHLNILTRTKKGKISTINILSTLFSESLMSLLVGNILGTSLVLSILCKSFDAIMLKNTKDYVIKY